MNRAHLPCRAGASTRPLVIGAVLGLLAALPAARAAGSDRIFANGFDPCCQIGGTVSGLAGSGLVLHLAAGAIAEDKPIAGDGLYDFTASVPPGTAYSLSVTTQPAGQTCAVAIVGGTMGGADIDNADVTCTGNLEWDAGNWGDNWN